MKPAHNRFVVTPRLRPWLAIVAFTLSCAWAGTELVCLHRSAVRLAAIEATAAPSFTSNLMLRANSRTEALNILEITLAAAARAEEVRLSLTGPDEPQAIEPTIAFRISATGSQANLLRFADRLETARPVVRLRAWRLSSNGAPLRLTAEAVAAWSLP